MKKDGKVDQHATIRTERLTLRSMAKADEDLFVNLFTNKKIMRFVGPTMERARAVDSFGKALALTHAKRFTRRLVVLVERATKKPVGISSIHLSDAKTGRAQVGTLLKSEAHSKRYGMECSVALISKAFTRRQVKLLEAHVAEGHKASESLVKALGFSPEGMRAADKRFVARQVWTLKRADWIKRMESAVK